MLVVAPNGQVIGECSRDDIWKTDEWVVCVILPEYLKAHPIPTDGMYFHKGLRVVRHGGVQAIELPPDVPGEAYLKGFTAI